MSRGVLLDPLTGRPVEERDRLVLPELERAAGGRPVMEQVLRNLALARLQPRPRMTRQYFEDLVQDPPSADLTAVIATTETALWSSLAFTPIPAYDARAGKVYRVWAGGIVSTGASGTLTITPRYGTSIASTTLGASAAQTVPINLASVPWSLVFTLVFRQIGLTASSSTCVGTGLFTSQGTIATAGSAFVVSFGGTVATTADTTTAQGVFIGWTLSVAGSCTPRYAFIQSLN